MKKLKLVYLILFAFLITNISVFAQQMDNEAAKFYNTGNDQLKAGNYNGAIDNYNKALAISKDYRIYYQKGIALKKSNKTRESVDVLNECIKLKPDFDAGYNALAGSYFSLGEYENAIANFEKVLEVSKNNSVKNKVKEHIASSYAKLASAALNDGNTNRAIEYLNKAIEKHNSDVAYLTLAQTYNDLANWDKAIEAAENAAKYRKTVSKGAPAYYLGLAYKGKGDTTKARQYFNEAKSDNTYRKTAEYELSLLK